MTVVGLIELLGRLPPETMVVTRGDTGYFEPNGTYEFSGEGEGLLAVTV